MCITACHNTWLTLFADDLTAEHHAPVRVTAETVMQGLRGLQQRTHKWGVRNQVSFDASKEHLKIIHPRAALGEDFKMLGTLFDCKLSMQPCIEDMLAKARPKVRALIRIKHLFSVASLVNQYKTHVWGFSEYSNGAIILASPFQLKRIDRMQRWFLKEIGITDTEAFLVHNFAPPSLRRTIGILGLLHKRVLCLCHPGLIQALPFSQENRLIYHNKTLHTFLGDVRVNHKLYFKSLYGYTHMYNRLTQTLVDLPSVCSFQAKLTHLVKTRAEIGDAAWRQSLDDSGKILQLCHA